MQTLITILGVVKPSSSSSEPSVHLVLLQWRSSIKFSLSGRDDNSNRFLPSWRIIPNTNPDIPHEGSHRSSLVQLRNQLRWPDQRCILRDATLPGRSELVTRPWAHANSSPHIFTSSRVRTFYLLTSGLSWATRLHSQKDLSGQLNVRHAFNMTREPPCLSP
jgi:hypothetical protein